MVSTDDKSGTGRDRLKESRTRTVVKAFLLCLEIDGMGAEVWSASKI